HSQYNKFPPAYSDGSNGTVTGSLFYSLLPFLELDNIYDAGGANTTLTAYYPGGYPTTPACNPIKAFRCPSDPTAEPTVSAAYPPGGPGWGVASYAINNEVFGIPNPATGASTGAAYTPNALPY